VHAGSAVRADVGDDRRGGGGLPAGGDPLRDERAPAPTPDDDPVRNQLVERPHGGGGGHPEALDDLPLRDERLVGGELAAADGVEQLLLDPCEQRDTGRRLARPRCHPSFVLPVPSDASDPSIDALKR
jgi:hypothetical protein